MGIPAVLSGSNNTQIRLMLEAKFFDNPLENYLPFDGFPLT